MKVHNVMTHQVEVIRPEASLKEAAERMESLNVGALPVCSENRLVGVLTDRDIAIRSVADGHDPLIDRVCDAMTPEVVYCLEDDDVAQAARIMKSHQIRRLPVLDREKRLVGIVSLGDLAVEIGDDRMVGDTLEKISEPAHPTK